MKLLFTPVVLMALLLSGEAWAEARYVPAENNTSYYNSAAVNNPQPLRADPIQNHRVERVNMMQQFTRMPVYRNTSYNQTRIAMPRNVVMPRSSFRVDMNPAGPLPH